MGFFYGPVYIQGDNQYILENTNIPNYTLKKKSYSTAYHFVRYGAARDEWRTEYVNNHDNEAYSLKNYSIMVGRGGSL